MIKKFGEYINESMNGFTKGDVIEVISMFGQTDDLPDKTAKYIGRIYIVDDVKNGQVKVLGDGNWSIQDVRKLSSEEVQKRQPEIQEIRDAWEKRKAEYRENELERLDQAVKNLHSVLNYTDEDVEISKVIKNSSGGMYKATLRIEKLN